MKQTQILKTIAIGTLASVLFSLSAQAQSAEALINKLVEKGILTQEEAQKLRVESTNDFNRAFTAKTGMAPWVTSLKFGGDFRGRYDGIYQNESNTGAGSATQDRQ